jgi:hypothetical protein
MKFQKFYVWTDYEYFEDIYERKENIRVGLSHEDAVEDYIEDTGLELSDCPIIYAALENDVRHVILKMEQEGFFTKEMEDEIFSKSEKFDVTLETHLRLVKRLES